MPPEQAENNDQNSQPVTPPPQTGPTPEQIEMTKRVMHDSLAGRKEKSFLDRLKEWFK